MCSTAAVRGADRNDIWVGWRLRHRVNGFLLEFLGLFPSRASVDRTKETARGLVPVARRINDLGITRIDEQLIQDKLGIVKID